MKELELAIFDCDGTLYRQPDQPFLDTPFWNEVSERSIDLIMDQTRRNNLQAELFFNFLFDKYDGEISQGMMKEVGVPIEQYFVRTWGQIDPGDYVREWIVRREILDNIRDCNIGLAVLSNAPAVWVERVLEFVGVADFFKDLVWTGEGKIRKPKEDSYIRVANHFGVEFKNVVMIGDEEKNDIVVPNKIGINTILVNPYGRETNAMYQITEVNEIIRVLK